MQKICCDNCCTLCQIEDQLQLKYYDTLGSFNRHRTTVRSRLKFHQAQAKWCAIQRRPHWKVPWMPHFEPFHRRKVPTLDQLECQRWPNEEPEIKSALTPHNMQSIRLTNNHTFKQQQNAYFYLTKKENKRKFQIQSCTDETQNAFEWIFFWCMLQVLDLG